MAIVLETLQWVFDETDSEPSQMEKAVVVPLT